MNEDQVRSIVDSMLSDAQYNVAKVPYHTHNGTDSPPTNAPAAASSSQTIARDFGSTGGAAGGTSTTAHTCAGDNRLLVTVVGTSGNGSVAPSSVTYAGINMTLLSSQVAFATVNLSMFVYYLLSPTLGTNNIIATFSNGTPNTVNSLSYTGVSQTSFPNSASASTVGSTGTTVSQSTAVTKTWCWLIGGWGSNGTSSAGTATSLPVGNGSSGLIDSGQPVIAGTPSLTMNTTAASGAAISIMSVAAVASS